VSDMLIKEMEVFYSFAIHLQFDFIEDLIRFVPPIHAVTKKLILLLTQNPKAHN